LKDERQVSDEEATAWAQKHGIEYNLTSGKMGTNVGAVYDGAVRAAIHSGLFAPKKPVEPQRSGKDARQFFDRTKCEIS
jgi:hypothetical protein